ncbi:RNA polymerase factor sigma-54 [Terrihabitans sp. B22-R8]|uniref:RNA polymerase factor sigma-54 n=1 Tax=Terrihabitans sp. B22-R8 TaxID=3425128 RepID=UPI00403CA749
MSLSPKLMLRQTQSLIMTPQLMQAIKLLQLSSLDLENYVAQEIESNPLLERVEERPEPDGGDEGGNSRDVPAEDGGWLDTSLPESRAAIEERLDADLGNVFPDEAPMAAGGGESYVASSWSGLTGGGGGDGDLDFETSLSAPASLADHLERQFALICDDPRLRLVGRAIIDSLDECGYFREPVEDFAQRLGVSAGTVETALGFVQSVEPAGIAARSLAECLALQLRDRNRYDPAMEKLLANLDLVARRDFTALRRLCGVDAEDLAEMVAELRHLTPKPGLSFSSFAVQTIVPDVLVRAAPDGTWLVELNSEALPRVLVNQAYHARVSRTAKRPDEKAFLTECLQNANWLTRSLEQRARTILKVASEIVRQQNGFLMHGVDHLRPMNLRAVADVIGMHESTVSRVTSNKYIATPRGQFELKYFFTAAISATGHSEAHSAEAVRHRIRQMIDREPPSEVLSDDAIVQHLRGRGVDIARRTVAKYRESMGIPSSVQRRREKVAAS